MMSRRVGTVHCGVWARAGCFLLTLFSVGAALAFAVWTLFYYAPENGAVPVRPAAAQAARPALAGTPAPPPTPTELPTATPTPPATPTPTPTP
ncbi:MAG: hypothetical protein ACE5G8_10485, partial [Anaerolineae bacterium]